MECLSNTTPLGKYISKKAIAIAHCLVDTSLKQLCRYPISYQWAFTGHSNVSFWYKLFNASTNIPKLCYFNTYSLSSLQLSCCSKDTFSRPCVAFQVTYWKLIKALNLCINHIHMLHQFYLLIAPSTDLVMSFLLVHHPAPLVVIATL